MGPAYPRRGSPTGPGLPRAAGPGLPWRGGEPRGGGGRGSRYPSPSEGVSIPSGAAGGRAASPPSLTGGERRLVQRAEGPHRNKSERRRPRAAAPGRRRGEPGSRAAEAAARRRSFKKRLVAKRAVELLGPGLGKKSLLLPRRAGAQARPRSTGLPPGDPPSRPQQQEKTLPAGAPLHASIHPACMSSVGLAPPPAPMGLAGPCGQAGRRGTSPRGVSQGFPQPPSEAAALQSLPPPPFLPQRSGSGAQAGSSTV